MFTAEKSKKHTVEDYMRPKEGSQFQLINNDWVMLPPPVASHQAILTKIVQIIYNFLDSINDKGFLAAGPVDIKLDEINIFHPDIFYITENRKSEIVKERIEGAPDFVVEIISLESAYYDMRQKKDIYEKHGVKEYIIIDTIGLKAELYTLKNNIYHLGQKVHETAKLNSLLLPGLILDMNKIFQF